MKTNVFNSAKKKFSGHFNGLVIVLMLVGLVVSVNQTQAQDWEQLEKVILSDPATPGDLFGWSVYMDGNYAIIGARQEDWDASGNIAVGNAGAAYIIELDGNGEWQEMQKIVPSDRGLYDNFGWDVAISGNYAIVGTPLEDHDASGADSLEEAGSAYIFELDANGTWQEVKKLVASDRDSFDRFGYCVAISGNYAIVGAYSEDEDASGNNTLTNAGAAYMFERDGSGNWQEVQKIVASDRGNDDRFGVSVSISGNYAIAGADQEDEDARGRRTKNNSGSAYIFERNSSGSWQEAGKIVSSDRQATDRFGNSVSMDGNLAVIGAVSDDHGTTGNAGSAYIFERNGKGEWKQAQQIVASDARPGTRFGHEVSIASDHVIVGNRVEHYDVNGNNYMNSAGAAYIYEQGASGTWQEVDKIVASDRAELDQFGYSVSIYGDYAIVGAENKDEDGNPGGWIAYGAAYLFHRLDACDQSTLAAEAGADANTYFGYTPTECADLSGSASGGATPYTYAWEGAGNNQDVTVCPSSTTVYTLTVTDSDGCTATDNVTVNVTNVKCKGKKVQICHSGSTECVNESEVASHLAHGDYLGECGSANKREVEETETEPETTLTVYPNPTDHLLHVKLVNTEEVESVTLFDLSGTVILHVKAPVSDQITLDVRSLSVGIYILSVNHIDGPRQNIRVIRY